MREESDEAVTHFQAAEQEDPTIPETHVNLAMALAAAGQTDQAEKHFDQAANLIAQAESPEMIPQG